MPPRKGSRRKPSKTLNVAEIIKVVSKLNDQKETGKITTAEDIANFLLKRVTIVNVVKNDPNIITRLIDEAVAQGKIYSISMPDKIVYRTPKNVGEDHSMIVYHDGDVPASCYFQIVKAVYNISRDDNGITSKEWIDLLHDESKFLNYNQDVLDKKLIPDGIKNGHIIEKVDEGNDQTKTYMITDLFNTFYKLFRRNRSMALHIMRNGKSNFNDPNFLKTVSEAMGNGDSRNNSDDDNNDDEDDGNDRSEADGGGDGDVSLNNADPSENNKIKSPLIRKEFSPSNQPQRVSQRKRFKKSLGPDFVESDTVMSYETSRSRNSTSSTCTHNNSKSTSTQSSTSKSTSQQSQSASKSASLTLQSSSSSMTPSTSNKPEQLLNSSQSSSSSTILCLICQQPYRNSQKINSPIVCYKCGSKAHGTCFRTFIGNSPTTNWICSKCSPDDVCHVCGIFERSPDFYLSCQRCSTKYHSHCWREKAHAACQKCELRYFKPTIIEVETNETNLSFKSSNESINQKQQQSLSKPKPKVSTVSLNNNKINKSNSLLQSNAVAVNGNEGDGTNVLSIHPSIIISSNRKSLINKDDKQSKVTIEQKKLPQQNITPTITNNSEEEPITTTSVDQNSSFSALPKSDLISGTGINHPVTLDLNPSLCYISTPSLSSSPTSRGAPKVLDPLLKHYKTINNKKKMEETSCIFTHTNVICYNFQAWLRDELKVNRPFDDLTPLCNLPDSVLDWTKEDVYAFISTLGFQEQADYFLEIETDGVTMLFLNRDILLNTMKLKIGPTLKLLSYLNRLHDKFA